MDEIAAHLLWHAGWEAGNVKRLSHCSCERLHDCVSRGMSPETASRSVEDVIDALALVNKTLNGEVPSEKVFDEKVKEIPRDLVYGVMEVVDTLRNASHQLVWSEDAIWTVETVWRAVIDGDIDDLNEHLRLERRAREK